MNDEIRRKARELGVSLSQVRAIYRDLRRLQREERRFEWETRKEVWSRYAYSKGSESFWRHGMRVRFRYAFNEGDRTAIPGWDDACQELGWDVQELFDFIKRDHTRLPTAEETWMEALSLAMPTAACAVPF